MNALANALHFENVEINDIHFLELIARGAFAPIYLAHQVDAFRKKREVAVKIFADIIEDRESFRQTCDEFQREMEPLRQLSREGAIVQYHIAFPADFYVRGDLVVSEANADKNADQKCTGLFIVMEYADGGSVGPLYTAEVVQKAPSNNYLNHFINICGGLLNAHAKEIFHQDIKPKNLLWFRDIDKVKIADFGLADTREFLTNSPNGLVGTYPYLAPECFGQGTIDRRKRDIYALGCTFYEMLTGIQAFHISENDISIEKTEKDLYLSAHLSPERPNPMRFCGHLTDFELNELIRKMMAIEPNDRPDLETVISSLRSAKHTASLIDHPIQISEKIVFTQETHQIRTNFLINPLFRKEFLNETLFFIFLELPYRNKQKINHLFCLLDRYFGVSYGAFEVYGKADFVIRVWTKEDGSLLERLCDQAIQFVLDGDRTLLNVFRTSEVRYCLNPKTPSSNIEVTEALTRIHEIQESFLKNEITTTPQNWLRRRGIYLRKTRAFDPKKQLKCFTLLSLQQGKNEPDKNAQYAVIFKKLLDSQLRFDQHRMACFSRSYTGLAELPDTEYDIIVSYVAKNFAELRTVPSILFEGTETIRIKSTTLIATGGYFVFGDGIDFGPNTGIRRLNV